MRISCLEKSFWNNLVNVSPIVAAPLFSVMQNDLKKNSHKIFLLPVRGETEKLADLRRNAPSETPAQNTETHNTRKQRTRQLKKKKKKTKQIQIPIEMRNHLRESCHVVCLFNDCFRPVLGGY